MGFLSKRTRREIRDIIAVRFLSLGVWFVRKIHYERASRLGAILAIAAFLLFPKTRRKCYLNLRRAFPEATFGKIKQITRGAFQNFLRGAFEVIPYGELPDEEKKRYVEIQGKEKIDAALSRGKGLIALSAHTGNFMIMMTRLSVEGYKVDLLVKRMKGKRIEGYLNELRKGYGFNAIHISPGILSVRTSLGALRENHILVVLGDQKQRKGGVRVRFFGRETTAAPGAVWLARSSGAPIVPMFMLRNPDGITHRLIVGEPLQLEGVGGDRQYIAVNTQLYTNIIEEFIRRHPEQWVWDYRRWR